MSNFKKFTLIVSIDILILLTGSPVNANTYQLHSCEDQWQAAKTSVKKGGLLNYAEFLSKCRMEKPKFDVQKDQPTKRKNNVTVILKSPPTSAPSTKIVINEKPNHQKLCLAEWKAIVSSSNLKSHPRWPQFLKQCKHRIKSKSNNN